MATFAEWLAATRQMRGLSQRSLAAKADITQPAITKIEDGGGASPGMVRKLADALEVDPAEAFRVWAQDAASQQGVALKIESQSSAVTESSNKEGDDLPPEMIDQLTEMILRLPPEDWEDALQHLDVITRGLKAARNADDRRVRPSGKY